MIIGHQRIWNFLMQSAAKERLAHAYLFVGQAQVGKKKVALAFVKALQCEKAKSVASRPEACGQCRNCILIEKGQHPDVLFIDPTQRTETFNYADEQKQIQGQIKNQEIKIGAIRQLQHQISLSPFSAKYKVVIIDSAEQMTQEAANCLLKTLEEPPQRSLLILISSNWQMLLPTVISRCQLIRFLPVGRQALFNGLKELGFKEKAKIEQAIKFSCGRPGVAINILTEREFLAKEGEIAGNLQKLVSQDLVEKFRYAQKLAQNSLDSQEVLTGWLIYFRDQMLLNVGAREFAVLDEKNFDKTCPSPKILETIKNIQETQRLLGENSFNARLILENLMIKI